jgi:hypothetical protein
MMTEMLRRAFARAQELPEEDQNRLGAWILEEIAADQPEAEPSGLELDLLEHLAGQARAEDEAGLTRSLEDVLEDYRRHGRFVAR